MTNKIKVLLISANVLALLISCEKKSSQRFKHEDYFSNGALKSRVWYKDGKEDGFGYWFFENNNLEVKAFYKDGRQVGPSYYYSPEGRLKAFIFYNLAGDGTAMYGKKYDAAGNIIEEGGGPISVDFTLPAKVKRNEIFTFTALMAKPPDSKMDIFIQIQDNENDMKETKKYQASEGEYFVQVQYRFKSKGSHPIDVFSSLQDTVRGIIRRDTINFEVQVE